TGVTVENVRQLPRLDRLFERLAVRPTYFTTYQVAIHPWAVRILQETQARGTAEIGAHLHPWNTPPIEEAFVPRNTMLVNLRARRAVDRSAADLGIQPRLVGVVDTPPTVAPSAPGPAPAARRDRGPLAAVQADLPQSRSQLRGCHAYAVASLDRPRRAVLAHVMAQRQPPAWTDSLHPDGRRRRAAVRHHRVLHRPAR